MGRQQREASLGPGSDLGASPAPGNQQNLCDPQRSLLRSLLHLSSGPTCPVLPQKVGGSTHVALESLLLGWPPAGSWGGQGSTDAWDRGVSLGTCGRGGVQD